MTAPRRSGGPAELAAAGKAVLVELCSASAADPTAVDPAAAGLPEFAAWLQAGFLDPAAGEKGKNITHPHNSPLRIAVTSPYRC